MMTCILYAQNQLITYTVPSDGVELKDDFTRVRQSGSGWKEVVTYPMKVDEDYGICLHLPQWTDYADGLA